MQMNEIRLEILSLQLRDFFRELLQALITSAHQHAQLESRHILEISRSKALLDIAQEIAAHSSREAFFGVNLQAQ